MAAVWRNALVSTNVHTVDAIIRSQLEDVEGLINATKGKQREGVMSDAELAIRTYLEELTDCGSVVSDRRMAQSIALAVLRDANVVEDALEVEDQIAADRRFAVSLADDNHARSALVKTHSTDIHEEDPWQEQELLAKAAALYMTPIDELANSCAALALIDDDNEVQVGESSSQAETRSSCKSTTSSCIACGDDKHFYDVARVPCNHEYCRACLTELFVLSMKDESLFPPRCDGREISLKRVRLFLPADVASEFEARYEELSTKNRVYCYDKTCSTFIPPAYVDEDGIASCPTCGRTTCATCKDPSHTGDCPQDAALQHLIETAEAEQWQRCYQCQRFVDLHTGCNHITCPCGAQFCYVCGMAWKTCPCEQWDEARLEARAAQIVDRHPHRQLFHPPLRAHPQPPTRSVQQAEASITAGAASVSAIANLTEINDLDLGVGQGSRAARVAAAAQHLRVNHACTHAQWKWTRGGHLCEECSHWLPEYIFECRQCSLQACNRCRRNRL